MLLGMREDRLRMISAAKDSFEEARFRVQGVGFGFRGLRFRI